EHLGVAMANVSARARLEELHRVQDEVVDALQQAVRPPALDVENVEMDVAYVPAGENTPTGGDLYDWIRLPDGTLHVVVIDVMGKGVDATKDAVATIHALRALSFSHPLEDLVAKASAVMESQNPEVVATLVVVHHDPVTGHTRIAGAGHPPALLVHDGIAVEVDAPGIPLGFPGGGSGAVAEVTLERGDSLVLYTDGLIEATKDIIAGLAALANAAEACADYPAREMAVALVERALAGAQRRDDSLALVLRRRVPPSEPHRALGPFEHHISASFASIPLARHLLLDWLLALPVDDQDAADLALVATELCTNAVRHGAGAITLAAHADGTAVVLDVSDQGRGFALTLDRDAPDDAEAGRGLRLVASICDELDVRRVDGCSVVRAVRRAVVSST
ncbi:MAG TPA: SpoIIE family protein phosphatase, partial [Acidimicrobiales bacterium]|nr:SpoIIE family protein phosphatase [Acidimicrobiales bacterium]